MSAVKESHMSNGFNEAKRKVMTKGQTLKNCGCTLALASKNVCCSVCAAGFVIGKPTAATECHDRTNDHNNQAKEERHMHVVRRPCVVERILLKKRRILRTGIILCFSVVAIEAFGPSSLSSQRTAQLTLRKNRLSPRPPGAMLMSTLSCARSSASSTQAAHASPTFPAAKPGQKNGLEAARHRLLAALTAVIIGIASPQSVRAAAAAAQDLVGQPSAVSLNKKDTADQKRSLIKSGLAQVPASKQVAPSGTIRVLQVGPGALQVRPAPSAAWTDSEILSMKSRQDQSDLEEATAAAEAMSAAADALSNMEHLLAKSEEASAMLAEAKQQVKIIRAASAALEASTTSDYLVRRVLSACVSYVLE